MPEERTEAPTPRRRRKAREEGQVARSAELVGSAVLLVVLVSVTHLMPTTAMRMSEYFLLSMTTAARDSADPGGLPGLMRGCVKQVGVVAAPMLGLAVAGALVGNVAQVGWHFSTKQLQPQLSRLDPIAGFKRLFALRSLAELVKGLVKVAIVIACCWTYLRRHVEWLATLASTTPVGIGRDVGDLAYGLSMRMVGALVAISLLDYAFQRWQFERSLRMTKQEVKDELKEAEGNPEIKARVRQRQREMARRRMMADVARASVVITNPSHYAVALQYAMGQDGAPKVVAKGQDLIAQRIREVAREHRVPVVENPPLARSLYRSASVGQEIPTDLYRAVAEVLALVWRTDARVAR